MATVQLTRFWMTNIVTQESLGAFSEGGRDRSHSVKGEVRTYAGGRQRAVGSLGSSDTWSVTLAELSPADVALLEDWVTAGVTVFARDHRGQSMYATFFEMGIKENMAQTWQYATYTASITLQRVDVTEGV